MAKTKTKFSITEAARKVGLHRNTLAKHISSRDLTFELDKNGRKKIDAAELARVYGDAFDIKREEGSKTSPKPAANTQEIKDLQEKLDDEISIRKSKDRERIEFLEDALSTALKTDNTAILLLENQSKELRSQSQENLKTIDDLRTTNSEQDEKLRRLREKHKTRVGELQSALVAEQKKSLWQKLFGAGS